MCTFGLLLVGGDFPNCLSVGHMCTASSVLPVSRSGSHVVRSRHFKSRRHTALKLRRIDVCPTSFQRHMPAGRTFFTYQNCDRGKVVTCIGPYETYV